MIYSALEELFTGWMYMLYFAIIIIITVIII